MYNGSRAVAGLAHPLLPGLQLSLHQEVELRAREGQEVEHLIDTAQEFISLEVMLRREYRRLQC